MPHPNVFGNGAVQHLSNKTSHLKIKKIKIKKKIIEAQKCARFLYHRLTVVMRQIYITIHDITCRYCVYAFTGQGTSNRSPVFKIRLPLYGDLWNKVSFKHDLRHIRSFIHRWALQAPWRYFAQKKRLMTEKDAVTKGGERRQYSPQEQSINLCQSEAKSLRTSPQSLESLKVSDRSVHCALPTGAHTFHIRSAYSNINLGFIRGRVRPQWHSKKLFPKVTQTK